MSACFASAWDGYNVPDAFNTSYNPTNYNYNLTQLKTSGTVDKEHTPWADSYWPKQRGGFAYRWRQFQSANENQTLGVDERQEKFFNYQLYNFSDLKKMTEYAAGRAKIDALSPLEKYSIYIGDYNYALVQKYLNGNGNGPERVSWEGYCHAWAPAATQWPEPAPNFVINRDGIPINFGSGDVKALIVANYHEAMFPTDRRKVAERVYIGKGCNTDDTFAFLFPTTKIRNGVIEMAEYGDTDGLMDDQLEDNVRAYQDGLRQVLASNPNSVTLPYNAQKIANDRSLPSKARKRAQVCQGVNAGTFHVVIANQLGEMHKGFELDKTRDNQIWNQPARGFHSTITQFSAPLRKSARGTVKVAYVETSLEYAQDTDYSWTFWNPTLKGLFRNNVMDPEFAAEYNLYTSMLKNQGDVKKGQTLNYPDNVMDSAHYKYTLDLDEDDNIIGGDWLTLDRPDTLWIMEPKTRFEGNFTRLKEIYTPAQL